MDGRLQARRLELTGEDPLSASSWTKKSTPVFQRNDSASDGCDNGRTTRAQEFTWNADGTPNFGTPAALGTSSSGPSGEAASTPTTYTILSRNSGKCLDVENGGTGNGTNVRQWTCNGLDPQEWRIEDLGDDTSRLVNVATRKILDTAYGSSADGADLWQWSWLDNTCQRFRFHH